MQLNNRIFREYDIRGVADRDLSAGVALAIGRAYGTFLSNQGGRRVTVGRDCRLSSNRIHGELVEGLLHSGISVVDIGLVPTPLLYFSVFEHNTDGGIMITGSHNPPDQNGFKMMLGKGPFFGEQIQQLKDLIYAGKFSSGTATKTESSVDEAYCSYVCRDFKIPLNVPVVVDSGNGMAGKIAPELFRKLGCQVTALYSELDGTFPNHHPDPTVLENLADLKACLTKTPALAGIGFDGDADRIGVMDPSGQVIFGDELLILYARAVLKKNPKAKIISDVKASHRLFNDIRAHGGTPILWKTGHSLIKSKMKEEKALLAGEMSGHVFFADRYFGYDDAIYAGARLLEILSETRKTPSELLSDVPKSFCTPEIRVDCPDDIKFDVVKKATRQFESMGWKVVTLDGARAEFSDGWGLVRASNTQPVLVYRFEANSQNRLDEIRDVMQSIVGRLISEA